MKQAILTFFYSGRSPIASGTAGSFAAAVVIAFAMFVVDPSASWGRYAAWQAILGAACIGLSAACVCWGPWAIARWKSDDPKPVVADEAAAMCLAMLFMPVTSPAAWYALAGVFFVFRVLDVWKPPPARQLEDLPAGWGILMDDLAAGVMTNVIVNLGVRWLL